MSAHILGIGTALPAGSIAQTEAAEIAVGLSCRTPVQSGTLRRLYRLSGVEQRHSVLVGPRQNGTPLQTFYQPPADEFDGGPTTQARMQAYATHAPKLARQAARAALADAGVAPADITHMVIVSCTGFYAPGLDCSLIESLELPATTARVQVGFMGCHGALNGLRVAQALVGSDPHATVLLCAVEICSLHYVYAWDPEQAVANALFADGAAALVLGQADETASRHWRLQGQSSVLIPETRGLMSWEIGDHGFVMGLSSKLPEAIRREIPGWLAGWLATHNLTIEAVRSWAVHPGGPRILASVADSLGLAPEALRTSREVITQFGNMSSPTVLFVLQRLCSRQAPTPCVALAFGPGIVAEAALFA